MNRLWPWLRFGFAIACLGLLAVAPWQAFVRAPWQQPPVVFAAMRVVPTDLFVLLGMALVGALARWPRLAAHGCALLLVAVTLFRLAIAYLPVVFQRPFELADVVLVPSLLHLLLVNKPVAAQVLVWSSLVGGLLLAHWLAARSFQIVVRPLSGPRARLWTLVLSQFALVAALLWPGTRWQPSTLLSLADMSVAAGRLWLDPEPEAAKMQATLAAGHTAMASAPHDLRGLAGIDVYVLVIESYGAVALRQPELAPHFVALWRELGAELQAKGFTACSGYVHPAIAGGGSWMAHQELFTAVRVGRQAIWDRVLASDCLALPKIFQRAGWRTVEVMPAMDRHWPEGQAFYGFDQSVTQVEMPYSGTVYSWGRMPDQFALHWLLANVVQPASQPLFATFLSVTSHAPWPLVPPLIADWQIDAATFQGPAAKVHAVSMADVPGGEALVPAYRDGVEYALRAAAGFVQRLPRPSLVLLLGDHQPPLAFPEPIDVTFDVPLHLLSNRADLLGRWTAHGFAGGLVPPANSTRPLAELAPLLLRLYAQ